MLKAEEGFDQALQLRDQRQTEKAEGLKNFEKFRAEASASAMPPTAPADILVDPNEEIRQLRARFLVRSRSQQEELVVVCSSTRCVSSCFDAGKMEPSPHMVQSLCNNKSRTGRPNMNTLIDRADSKLRSCPGGFGSVGVPNSNRFSFFS